MKNKSLLKVENLEVTLRTENGQVKVVDRVTFSVEQGKTLAIVGESGSGKSVTALSIIRLISNPGEISGGSIVFDGENILEISDNEIRKIRGNQIAMIFQDPLTSLNPVYTIGNQIIESITLHQNLDKRKAKEKAVEMLKRVGIPQPEKRYDNYPHEFSGGMRQRAMIAMALSCRPKLLIADEPTTALDVTVQAQILQLINELKESQNTGVVLITHDLGIVAEVADEVLVLYAGKPMEFAAADQVFTRPFHPYTIGLLNSLPKIEFAEKKRLLSIPGTLPSLHEMPAGCCFSPRCAFSKEICFEVEPGFEEKEPGRKSACLFAADELKRNAPSSLRGENNVKDEAIPDRHVGQRPPRDDRSVERR
jgi:oligopeptide/dipeptide ABC transporter ATP-binding protein